MRPCFSVRLKYASNDFTFAMAHLSLCNVELKSLEGLHAAV